jgi:hypothetical protein
MDYKPLTSEDKPLPPPEVWRFCQQIIATGIEHTRATLKSDYEKAIFEDAIELLRGEKAA